MEVDASVVGHGLACRLLRTKRECCWENENGPNEGLVEVKPLAQFSVYIVTAGNR
jgi:hypothetical protein